MPITPEQRPERKTRIFSTDLAALFGCDERRTADDVWAEKTMDLLPEPDGNGSAPWLEMGNRLEPVLLDLAATTLGPLTVNVTALHAKLPLGAHVDAVVQGSGEPVEATTAGVVSPFGDKDQFGDFETDQVPFRKILQAHAHMLCLIGDPVVCHLPVLIGGRGFGMYRVARQADLCKIIEDTVAEWWERHVVKGERPTVSPISLDILKRVRREPEKVADVPLTLVQELVACKAALKGAEKAEENARSMLLEALGDAEATQIDPEVGGFTYFSQSRSSIDVRALRAAMPNVAEQFTRTSTGPVLRYKKPPSRKDSDE